MPSTWSLANPLIPLDTELERTLRNYQRMVNKGIHDITTLLEVVHGGGKIHDQLTLHLIGEETME